MLHNKTQPCNDCPFRRVSMSGWTGEATPEEFIQIAMQDTQIPCHLTVDYSDPDWQHKLDTAEQCVGQLQFFNNHFKLSIHECSMRQQRKVGRNQNVFQFEHEFLEHHHTHLNVLLDG